jgi:hypothetical protein
MADSYIQYFEVFIRSSLPYKAVALFVQALSPDFKVHFKMKLRVFLSLS